MKLWKALGLAGVAGVAAAGVIIAREQRQRTQLSPEEVRARLHERLAQAAAAPTSATGPGVADTAATLPWWLPRWSRRRAAPLTPREPVPPRP